MRHQGSVFLNLFVQNYLNSCYVKVILKSFFIACDTKNRIVWYDVLFDCHKLKVLKYYTWNYKDYIITL